MPVNVYIDGFNLYYGLCHFRKYGKDYRWLDLGILCGNLLPNTPIASIRYFTARVGGKLDPDTPRRQNVYLRALRTIPNLEIHYGHFVSRKAWRHLVVPLPSLTNIPPESISIGGRNSKQSAHVTIMEEKGSDVNLATYLLLDCFQGVCDEAIVISNDSDLAEPIRVTREILSRDVTVFNPHRERNGQLEDAATLYLPIEEKHFQASLFPDTIQTMGKPITKPATWT